MRNLLLLFLITLASCQAETKDITGHWTVAKQISDGKEVTPSNSGILFGENGVLELEWVQKPNVALPETHYRVSNDTIYWNTSDVSSQKGAMQEGKLIIEWQGENLIIRADKNNYTVLERTAK